MLKKIVNLILVAVILLNFALLFQPYWTYGEGEEASVADYILMPKAHKELTSELKEVTGEKKLLTNVALPLFVLMMLDTVGTVAGLLLLKTRTAGIFALVRGITGVAVFLTDVIVKGQPLWVLCIVASGVLALLGLGQLIAFDYYPVEK